MLGIVSGLALLASGLLLILLLSLTPEPGAEPVVLILKGVALVGWLAIGGWLVGELLRARFRVVLAPIGAWLGLYLMATMLGTLGYLNIGY